MLPMPLVEEIMASHAGRPTVSPGELIDVKVDRVYVQDGNSPTIAKLFAEHGFETVFNPERVGLFFDHSVLPPNTAMADRLAEAKVFAGKIGAQVFRQGEGISHVLAMEQGWFTPGSIVLGADSHTCVGGAVQSLALGMGASDIVAAMVTGRTWLKVPETVWINVVGMPSKHARARDVALHCLATHGQASFLYKSMEWIGEWSASLSPDEAASLASLGVELGAKCSFLPPVNGRSDGMRPLSPVKGGRVLNLDINGLSPMVAKPHSPSNVVPLEALAGLEVGHVFVGSCTNSRFEDLEQVATVLSKRQVHPDVHLVVAPGSRAVYLQALEHGLVETFLRAGAIVAPPGCGACVGAQGSIPGTGERVLSTMNRNFQGRMGNAAADIFLASPLVAAVTALHAQLPTIEELDQCCQ